MRHFNGKPLRKGSFTNVHILVGFLVQHVSKALDDEGLVSNFPHPWVNKTKQHTPFEEEKEGAGTASDIVKVGGEVEGDLATPGCLREDRARRYVGDSQSWVRLPWFARDETPGP